MKKIILPLALLSLFAISCGSESNDDTKSTENSSETVNESADADMDEGAGATIEEDLIASIVHKGGAKSEEQILIEEMMATMEADESVRNQQVYGHWVGKFGKNMINITLSNIDGGSIEGYSVCAGNFRKITGTINDDGSSMLTAKMDEPGTNQYDGTFEFTVDLSKKELTGHWTPFKSEGNSAKDFTLKKKSYEYDPNIGVYPEGSKEVLSDEFLMDLDEYSLGYMRNEIYARHGYSFKNKEWRYEFEGKDWYIPMGVDIRDLLTDIEIKNIGLIYEYESYYDDYYDEYGR